jgi:AbrB family looped-hinge helix DNA binding protein
MKSAIDAAGRIVIPREVRRQAGLKPGMPLDIRFKDGRVEIEPAPLAVRLVHRGRLLTARPLASTPPLTAEDVQEARRSLRGRASEE